MTRPQYSILLVYAAVVEFVWLGFFFFAFQKFWPSTIRGQATPLIF